MLCVMTYKHKVFVNCCVLANLLHLSTHTIVFLQLLLKEYFTYLQRKQRKPIVHGYSFLTQHVFVQVLELFSEHLTSQI